MSEDTLKALDNLIQQWPQTPATDMREVGLDERAFGQVQQAQARLTSDVSKQKTKSVAELENIIKNTSALIEDLESLVDGDEEAFTESMRQKAVKIAKAISSIKAAQAAASGHVNAASLETV